VNFLPTEMAARRDRDKWGHPVRL